MTHAVDVPPAPCRDLAETVAVLRARGLRVSTSRRLLLEALFAAEGPVSAGHIAGRHGLDIPSVHRNLEMLEQHGIVRHVHLGHGPGLYALAGDGECEYLYCRRCSRIRTVASSELETVRDDLKRRFGYDVRFTHFAIVGLCSRCAQEQAPDQAMKGDEAMRDDDHEHEHDHDGPHSHAHVHEDGTEHDHPHTDHDHDHVEHEHEHSHGDHVHSHPHTHEKGLEDKHGHGH